MPSSWSLKKIWWFAMSVLVVSVWVAVLSDGCCGWSCCWLMWLMCQFNRAMRPLSKRNSLLAILISVVADVAYSFVKNSTSFSSDWSGRMMVCGDSWASTSRPCVRLLTLLLCLYTYSLKCIRICQIPLYPPSVAALDWCLNSNSIPAYKIEGSVSIEYIEWPPCYCSLKEKEKIKGQYLAVYAYWYKSGIHPVICQ